MDKERERLVHEAAKAWYQGSLSAFSAMVVIHSLLYPCKPTHADMEWARQQLGLPSGDNCT